MLDVAPALALAAALATVTTSNGKLSPHSPEVRGLWGILPPIFPLTKEENDERKKGNEEDGGGAGGKQEG